MNPESSKTSDPHRLLLNLSDKINSKSSDEYVAFRNLSIYYTWKNIKTSYKNNKYGSYLPDHILYQIFKNFLSKS